VTQFLISLAQAANPSPGQSSGQPSGGGAFGGLGGNPIILMVLIFAVMYFIVIRPQSKRAKETQRMLAELKKGDEVVTTGGIIGRISGIKDTEITLQVQEGVRIRIQRSAVTGRLKTSTEPTKTEAKAS
jgi:preprotein translocase subunit YajC